jgi:hypothetical protein
MEKEQSNYGKNNLDDAFSSNASIAHVYKCK